MFIPDLTEQPHYDGYHDPNSLSSLRWRHFHGLDREPGSWVKAGKRPFINSVLFQKEWAYRLSETDVPFFWNLHLWWPARFRGNSFPHEKTIPIGIAPRKPVTALMLLLSVALSSVAVKQLYYRGMLCWRQPKSLNCTWHLQALPLEATSDEPASKDYFLGTCGYAWGRMQGSAAWSFSAPVYGHPAAGCIPCLFILKSKWRLNKKLNADWSGEGFLGNQLKIAIGIDLENCNAVAVLISN